MMAKRPTMPKSDPEATAWFETLLPHDTRVVIRPMFGHRAAFINGHMFAGTFGPDVFVRLDERSRAELLTVEGTKPFEPMKGHPMMEYVQIPKRWLAEPSDGEVVDRAIARVGQACRRRSERRMRGPLRIGRAYPG
jgi:TfoX/Sxy family transcriptional regulator of competence genes